MVNAPILIEALVNNKEDYWFGDLFPDIIWLLWLPFAFLTIWVCWLFPSLILENEEGVCFFIDPDSFTPAIPDLQSFYYSRGDWTEYHLTSWRLSIYEQSNY